MNNEPKRTSFMRYARVDEILRSDNLLSRKLSKKTVAVCRPDQTHHEFSVEVVYVTDQIHKQGIDAYTMPKIDVIRTGHRLLVNNPKPIPDIVVPLETPARKSTTNHKVKVKVRQKTKVKAKVKTEKPPKRRRMARPKDAATADVSPAAVETEPAGVNHADEQPLVSEDEPLPEVLSQAPMPETEPPPKPPIIKFVRPYVPNVVGVAALSNLQAVLTLFEPYMAVGDADAKEVCQKVNELIDDIHRRTVLPSAEKEPSIAG